MPDAVAAFAPGRVNLIGEHTDYNDGLCLPFAIAQGVKVTACPAAAGRIEVDAADLAESDSFDPSGFGAAPGWRAYVRGTVACLESAGMARPGPVALRIEGDLPRGAGLGSSAALCVALGLALCAAWEAEPPARVELARLCSRVENEWVGAHTGLLDQLTSLLGQAGRALRIDMRGPTLQPVPLELGGALFATLDSGVSREHAASGYNRRREECAQACAALGVGSLREAREADAAALPAPLDRRVRHVLTENARVDGMVEALAVGRVGAAGHLLDASHASLRDDYEVSAPAVERTVSAARAAGALGARLMGGGFGGRVLALFPAGGSLPAGALRVDPGPGARLL